MALFAGQEYIDAVLSISLLVGILLFFLGLFNMVRLPRRKHVLRTCKQRVLLS